MNESVHKYFSFVNVISMTMLFLLAQFDHYMSYENGVCLHAQMKCCGGFVKWNEDTYFNLDGTLV